MTDPVIQILKSGKGAAPPRLAPEAAARPAVTVIAKTDVGIPMPPTKRDLSERLPDDAALLKIIPVEIGDGAAFRLEGYFRGRLWTGDESELTNQLKPRYSIAEVLGESLSNHDEATIREAAVKYYKYILRWSETKYSLANWLTKLRHLAGSALRLIVWDDTDLGIPWELYRHTTDDETVWIGTIAEIIRWTTIHDPARHDQFAAVTEQGSSGDKILAFEDANLLPLSGLSIGGVSHYRRVESLIHLFRALEAPTDEYGLIYVRAHGKHGADADTTELGGIALSDLAGIYLPAIRASGSVVLLNACNSARPVIAKADGDFANRNFAEVFLRQHARAVVATMGEVPTTSSAALARSIITMARADGVRLPELLRKRREDAASLLPPNTLALTPEQKQHIVSFLYTSMYAYFGHPDAVFRLGTPT